MILYHGSNTEGIETLIPFASNHDRPYVYFTHSEILAAIYAHNPMTRPNGFFTYWWDKDGILCYDEYFENQLEEMYSGQKGFVYVCEGKWPQLEKMPWVYLSEKPVKVKDYIEIPNLYHRLLGYEREGLLRVRRWSEASLKQREIWENVVKRSLAKTDIHTPSGMEYWDFIKKHFDQMNIASLTNPAP